MFGPAGKKPLAWLLICQESNISRGLAPFQVLPGAFARSVAELLARISWLWERSNACLPECSGSVFHLQLPGPALGDTLNPPLPAQPILHGQQRRPFVWLSCSVGGGASGFLLSPSPAFTSAQPRGRVALPSRVCRPSPRPPRTS